MCSFLALYSKVLVLPVWVLGLLQSLLYPACGAERTCNKRTKPFLFHQTSGFLWAGPCSWCLAGSRFSTRRHDCERGPFEVLGSRPRGSSLHHSLVQRVGESFEKWKEGKPLFLQRVRAEASHVLRESSRQSPGPEAMIGGPAALSPVSLLLWC